MWTKSTHIVSHLLHPLPCMLGYYAEIQIIFGTVYKDNGHDNLDLFNLKFWIKISVTIFYNLKIILQKLLIKKSRNLSSSCQKNLFSILIFTQFVGEQERKHCYSFLICGHCGWLDIRLLGMWSRVRTHNDLGALQGHSV